MTWDGGTDDEGSPAVLIAEGDPEQAEQYAAWLGDRWSVRTALDGASALDALADEPPVALVSRELADIHGDRLLGIVREQELDCRVAMVTTVDPGVDLARVGFDGYLVRPVEKAELVGTVEQLLARATYDELLGEYYALAAERARLEYAEAGGGPADGDGLRELSTRLSAVRSSLDEVLAELSDHDAYVGLCRELSRGVDSVDDAVPEL